MAELDLLVFLHGARFGFEFKYADAPTVTKSLQVARDDLGLRRAFVVHPGPKTYALNAWCEAVAIRDLRARTHELVAQNGPI